MASRLRFNQAQRGDASDVSRGCDDDPRLSPERIAAALHTRLVGRHLEAHHEIDSTNTRAAQLAVEGAADGTLVIADAQTAGRGRLGRAWHAPAKSSLLLSVVLRPPLSPTQAQRMTMLCSLALVEAIHTVTGVRAHIKWPNDVQIRDRKVAGLLAEAGLRGDRLSHVIVGMGVNVNLDVSMLPPLMAPATSLSDELGRRVSRLDLLVAVIEAIEARYLEACQGWAPHTEWRQHLATLGQHVRLREGNEVVEGMAEDVDPDGALLLRTADSGLRRVLVGDVTLRVP